MQNVWLIETKDGSELFIPFRAIESILSKYDFDEDEVPVWITTFSGECHDFILHKNSYTVSLNMFETWAASHG